MGLDKLANTFTEILKTPPNDTKPYDTGAEVTRIDDDGKTAWVHIPGGIDETPVEMTLTAKRGDNVKIRVSGGRAWIVGNGSAPPTDNTVANNAYTRANTALDNAEAARNAADKAEADAERAHAAADSAEQSAQEAKQDAVAANTAANSALTQLSVVEDVVGVLEWISEHATYKVSTDTEVVAGKMYFSKNGDVYTPIANPSGNPSTLGYYEIDNIDEAVTNYVSSHLALTNAGLWVVNDNNSYKILLASDGMKVYDSSGNLISTFGENIEFSSSVAQYIGGNDAYIVFNPTDGSLIIGGSKVDISGNITIGGRSRSLAQVLSEMQSEIDGAIETWYSNGIPTINNPPAVNWTTIAQKNQHLRDLYFDLDTGHTYRWAHESDEYKWIEITDTDAAAALAAAQIAQQTADSKVSDVIIEYAKSTDPTIQPLSGWSTVTPTWEEGKYIWQRTSKVVNGTTYYTYTCIQGAKGDSGNDGEDAVVLRIDSSRGTVFKNNQVSTVLTVTIFSGADIIKNIADLRNKFGNNAYLQWYWQKIDESDYGIIVSTDHKLSNDGFTLTLTPEEVDVKVTFRCELLI